MSATSSKELLNETLGASLSNDKGLPIFLSPKSSEYIFQIAVSRIAAGSVTAIVEHSIDKTNWFTLITFSAAIAAVSAELKFPTTAVGGYVRTSVTTAAATDADVTVKCGYSGVS